MNSHLIIEKAGPKWVIDVYSQTNQWGCYCGGFKSEEEAWEFAKHKIEKNMWKKDRELERLLGPIQLTLF